MAKKKKVTTLAKKNIDKSEGINSLTYQGKVKFQIMHGNKVISTKHFSNSGLPTLFKYLSYALTGTFYSALRPCKIALYTTPTDGDDQNPADFNWQARMDANKLTIISPYVTHDATPVVKFLSNSSTTTFRFKIPFNWLYSKRFNVIGLATEDNTPCAYYLFTKDKLGGGQEWEMQELDDITGNFSLVVEWTLEIANKS
jgi:hypothetical protein